MEENSPGGQLLGTMTLLLLASAPPKCPAMTKEILGHDIRKRYPSFSFRKLTTVQMPFMTFTNTTGSCKNFFLGDDVQMLLTQKSVICTSICCMNENVLAVTVIGKVASQEPEGYAFWL